MATRISSKTRRDLEAFGTNIARWRKIQGLTAQMVADRAAITRATLRSIEHGQGTAQAENLFAVLRVLGQSDAVVTATDPFNSDLGRLHAADKLPERVRPPRIPNVGRR
jgi:transcriptional regulator with XRE-family HTH domain